MNIFKNYDLDELKPQCIREAAELSRLAAAEGIVMLKNDGVLPFDKKKTLSIFGRTQIDYLKSGTGSGGLVNVEYGVNIVDGLRGRINLNENLLNIYKDWISQNPFDRGSGWAKEPWSQTEMPVSNEICADAAKKSDYAIVVIGRLSGEDRDNYAGEGSYLLTADEEKLIETVTEHFSKVCVVLNTGNTIDMKWISKYNVPCVLLSWQGGQEGGAALADVLLGDVSPSGRLTDTIAGDILDYPSTANFGSESENVYKEDIYVGYRFFETFAKDKVLYPFGFGLSYSSFRYNYSAYDDGDRVTVNVTVKNVGGYTAKTVVQIYYSSPCGKLGNPSRQLIAFKKTKALAPGESENVKIEFLIGDMASYDDAETFSYVLQSGEYVIYAGENVRDAQEIYKISLHEKTVKQLRQVLAPAESFKRMKAADNGSETALVYEHSPVRTYSIEERKKEHIGAKIHQSGNKGISLKDVYNKKRTLDEFVLQLSEEELCCLVRGEGMNSPKVTAGTGSCFGGVTDELLAYGLPPVCCTDGPSGIRMDSGQKATLMPNGTCLASTWNEELVEELLSYIGIELRSNEVDILLGPGVNIHRNPLNGRNFEYFSEDPLLSGKMAAAFTRGLDSAGVAGTVKHFACNSQEFGRHTEDSVVSERALREIYLKPFEIAVKEGKASAIMTSYNCLNGLYTASNYDLTTSVLRDEWGFEGIVMTDWWANVGTKEINDKSGLSAMVTAQNDIYMVVKSSKYYEDDLRESLESGALDIAYLRNCAKNILRFILSSPALGRKPKQTEAIDRSAFTAAADSKNIEAGKDYDFGDADALELEFMTSGSELAQYVINVLSDGENLTCALAKAALTKPDTVLVSLAGSDGKVRFEFSDSFTYMKATPLRKM